MRQKIPSQNPMHLKFGSQNQMHLKNRIRFRDKNTNALETTVKGTECITSEGG